MGIYYLTIPILHRAHRLLLALVVDTPKQPNAEAQRAATTGTVPACRRGLVARLNQAAPAQQTDSQR
eukprot:7390648-Prymnesium_polylepis.2